MESSGTGPRLIIVCGLPGSGKTTLAKALENRLRAVRFSPDDWMACDSEPGPLALPLSCIISLRLPMLFSTEFNAEAWRIRP